MALPETMVQPFCPLEESKVDATAGFVAGLSDSTCHNPVIRPQAT